MMRWFGKFMVALTGWRVEGEQPDTAKFVLLAAPHTSNWDFLHLLTLAWSVGIPVAWMGKHTLFWGPLGPLMRALGGVPVRRDRRNDLVQQMVDRFGQADRLVLTVQPEATRARAEFWKSGFYQIATAAGVPIHLGYLDYARRAGGFEMSLVPTGDLEADMDVLRQFYADKCARYPELVGPIRLREESGSQTD